MILYLLSFALLMLPESARGMLTRAHGGEWVWLIFSLFLFILGFTACAAASMAMASIKLIFATAVLPLLLYTVTVRSCYCKSDFNDSMKRLESPSIKSGHGTFMEYK